MRKVLQFILAFSVSVGVANAAVRSANSPVRQSQKNISSRSSRTGTTARTATNVTQRSTSKTHSSARATASTRRQQSAIIVRATTDRNTARATTARSATTINVPRTARATITTTASQSSTFGTGYNTCRDAYFTCMDQFCATANDSYRRCICSSKLSEVQSRERALTQASDQLQDFKDLNLSVIDKSANEVSAMQSATSGELAQENARDTSDSASKLSGISAVLSGSKHNALSTAGTLDIAGNINQIWSTTDLAGGTNLSNLTGESLYNAVHAQCSQMVATQCDADTTFNMVTSAYGMYIENDCSMLMNNLDKKLTNANQTIRDTEREMQLARLENYNTHNSTTINDCVAQVRADITAPSACGTDYVHCLDITGLYLNRDTGQPIYSPSFYQLESLTSLAGDVLTNQTNRMLVAKLDNMREYASRGLDTCRDFADDVWDEFMRQAISEIYQGQHDKIRQVKDECLTVVNECYDKQTNQLKDFSNVDEQLVLGARLELAEEMCQEKLDACSNLYGGGTNGLNELIVAMSDITDQKIGQECATALRSFVKKQCAVPGNDNIHSYPYGCRTYAPGDQRYTAIAACNVANQANKTEIATSIEVKTSVDVSYQCGANKKYTSCNDGYVMTYNGYVNLEPRFGNQCLPCPNGYTCANDTITRQNTTQNNIEPCLTNESDYVGSMYHMLAQYAADVCVRPSAENKYDLPQTILQDISMVMTELSATMVQELSKECNRLGGEWVNIPWTNADTNEQHDSTGDTKYEYFYEEVSANDQWGYCKTPSIEL